MMGHVFDSMIKFFQEENWRVMQIEDKLMLKTSISVDNGTLNCYAEEIQNDTGFVFYSYYPIKILEDKRKTAAEFFARVNYGLLYGNFEMDMRDGEVRYKTSIYVKTDPLPSPTIGPLVFRNINIADRYMPGLMGLLYTGLTPEKAVDLVENSH